MPNDVSLAAVYLRLALIGLSVPLPSEDEGSAQLVAPILARQRELSRQLSDGYCAADQRIQNFLDDYLADVYPVEAGVADDRPQLPRRTLVLDEAGLARTLSLPVNGDAFASPLLSPATACATACCTTRRATAAPPQGIVPRRRGRPADSRRQDRRAQAPSSPRCSRRALDAARDDLLRCRSPPTQPDAGRAASCRCCCARSSAPAVPGIAAEKTMEIRFFAPGSLVSNLDFVESHLRQRRRSRTCPRTTPALDAEHWTGHTGCVILAPHLIAADEEGPRPAALRPGDRAAAARRHVLARRGRAVQRRPARSRSPAATRAASSSR